MADLNSTEKLAKLLKHSVEEWNSWRQEHTDIRPNLSKVNLQDSDLSGANLSNTRLDSANLSGTNLIGANLEHAYLLRANLHRAKLSDTNLSKATLIEASLIEADASLGCINLSDSILRDAKLLWANLPKAKLHCADLGQANLFQTNLSEADLSQADLSGAVLVQTDLEKADLTGCRIYGIAAWDVYLDGATQNELIITLQNQPDITVEDMEVAQFIHLLVTNPKIKNVIDTVTSKLVLILGRFTQERKTVLDAIREILKHHNLVPVIFDFDRPDHRDLNETVRTLAHMAYFVVADITDPASIPQELTLIIPHLPSVPVQTIITEAQSEYSLYESWKRYPWVLPIFRYTDIHHLMASIETNIITPSEQYRMQDY